MKRTMPLSSDSRRISAMIASRLSSESEQSMMVKLSLPCLM
jgi:hypothetical protein